MGRWCFLAEIQSSRLSQRVQAFHRPSPRLKNTLRDLREVFRKAGPPAPRAGFSQSLASLPGSAGEALGPSYAGSCVSRDLPLSPDRVVPAKPLTDHASIFLLLDEMAEHGYSSAEVDILLVRQGPVDLDILGECKRNHPAFSPSSRKQLRLPRLKR